MAYSRVTRIRAPEAPTGWPSAISAAVDVQLALVEVQSLADGNRLRGKGLVGLDQIHVVDGQAGLGHDLLGGGDGAAGP